MLKKTVLFTVLATTFCAAAVACDVEGLEASDQLREEGMLCVASQERDTVRLELRDAEIAAAVSAPADEAPSVHVDFEGTRVQLFDDGLGPDRVASDGIFTGETNSSTPPFDEYCISGFDDVDADGAAGQRGRPQALTADEDPQALPPNASGCHEWQYVWSGNLQVWYCSCFSWDVWSC